MVDGFWIVEYEGKQGLGGGVAVFIKGHVFGGDSGSTYMGTFTESAKTIKARLRIHNYAPAVVNVTGIEGDYDLDLVGTVEGDIIKATGSPVDYRSEGLILQLTKAGTLPA